MAPPNATRSLKASYLAGDAALQAFYGWPTGPIPQGAAALRAYFDPVIAARRRHAIDRPRLVAALRGQFADFPPAAAVSANIAALGHPDTFCITTGQQPGLFGGPMYSIYKAMTAVALAEALQGAFPELRFVPVFWVAGEDHDWAEVNHAYAAFDRKLTYEAPVHGPVGRHVLGPQVQALHDNAVLRDCYAPGRLFGMAFRLLLHHALGARGLVVLDPDDPELKLAMAPLAAAEGARQAAMPQVQATTQALIREGYGGQIQAREVNLFWLDEDARLRLVPAGADLVGVEGSPQVLRAADLATHVARVSPGVVLRPLYQELLLPNLAYIGGWAEVAYWGQLKGVFDTYGVFYPALFPRMQARLLTHDEADTWQAAGFDWRDLDRPLHGLRDELVARHWQPDALLPHLRHAEEAFAALADATAALDAGQARNVRGQAARLARFRERLLARVRKQLANQHPDWVLPLRVKQARQPDGAVQERVLNWLAFADDPAVLVQHLWAQVDALAPGMQDVALPSAVRNGHVVQPILR